MDFSDLQGGKGSCDRKAENIKSLMRACLSYGRVISSAEDMHSAIPLNIELPSLFKITDVPKDNLIFYNFIQRKQTNFERKKWEQANNFVMTLPEALSTGTSSQQQPINMITEDQQKENWKN